MKDYKKLVERLDIPRDELIEIGYLVEVDVSSHTTKAAHVTLLTEIEKMLKYCDDYVYDGRFPSEEPELVNMSRCDLVTARCRMRMHFSYLYQKSVSQTYSDLETWSYHDALIALYQISKPIEEIDWDIRAELSAEQPLKPEEIASFTDELLKIKSLFFLNQISDMPSKEIKEWQFLISNYLECFELVDHLYHAG